MRKTLLTMAGAAIFAVTPLAQADDTAQLRAELADMKAQLSQLRQDQNENWLNERRAQEVKSLIHEVLSDADTRATLLQDGMTAGYDGRTFFLASSDGSFRLNVGGQIQIRYTYNYRSQNDADGIAAGLLTSQDSTVGFQIRRAKLDFSGHIGDPRIQYQIRLAAYQGGSSINDAQNNGMAFVGSSDSSVDIEIAKVSYQVADWASVYAGRLKAPFSRDFLVDSAYQTVIERSIADNNFGWGYTEGVGVVVQPIDILKIDTMINNGPAIPLVANGFSTGATTFAINSRAELLLMGNWEQFRGYSSWAGDDLGIMLGGAIGYVQDNVQNSGNLLGWTVDIGAKWNGLSVAAAGYGQHFQANSGSLFGDYDRYGMLVQASYNINDTIEPYIRWDYVDNTQLMGSVPGGFVPVGGANGGGAFNAVTAGANYYLKGNSAKLSLDVLWALQGTVQNGVAAFSGSNQGLMPSFDSQFAIRGQFQLLF